MRPRDVIKNGHESFVVERFVLWLNERTGRNYEVVGKPEPPDALIEYQGEHKWVEHADIYRSSEEAREEYSSVTPGEEAYFHTEHPIFAPNARIASRVYATLRNKLSKSSYAEAHGKYGPGILVLTERDQLFDKSTLNEIFQFLAGAKYDGDRGFFEAAYLGIQSMGDLEFFQLYPRVERTDEGT